MSFLKNKSLYNSSDAGTGDWVKLDTAYDNDKSRALCVYLANASDSIRIEATTVEAEADISTADIVPLKTYTESAGEEFTAPWTYIRAVKIGANGAAKVQGRL